LFKRLFCILSLLAFATVAEAATVRINPTKIRLIIPPGESRSGTIEVDNPSDESIIVKSYLEDWAYTPKHDGTKSFYPAGTTSFSAGNWVSISLNEFVIPAFGRQSVNFTVRVPEDASGGHYAVLFFESLLAKPTLKENAELGVIVRIGSLFYIEPEGKARRAAEISDFSLKQSSGRSALEMELALKNAGSVDLMCAGTFHIMDRQGMIFARKELGNIYLFPQDEAKLNATWEGSLSKGKYSLVITIDIGKAQEEAKLGRGPVIIKEAELEIGGGGEVVRVGELK
jgi:hypothetical protein